MNVLLLISLFVCAAFAAESATEEELTTGDGSVPVQPVQGSIALRALDEPQLFGHRGSGIRRQPQSTPVTKSRRSRSKKGGRRQRASSPSDVSGQTTFDFSTVSSDEPAPTTFAPIESSSSQFLSTNTFEEASTFGSDSRAVRRTTPIPMSTPVNNGRRHRGTNRQPRETSPSGVSRQTAFESSTVAAEQPGATAFIPIESSTFGEASTFGLDKRFDEDDERALLPGSVNLNAGLGLSLADMLSANLALSLVGPTFFRNKFMHLLHRPAVAPTTVAASATTAAATTESAATTEAAEVTTPADEAPTAPAKRELSEEERQFKFVPRPLGVKVGVHASVDLGIGRPKPSNHGSPCGCGCGCGSTTSAPAELSTVPAGASTDASAVTTNPEAETAEVTTVAAGKREISEEEDRQLQFGSGPPGRLIDQLFAFLRKPISRPKPAGHGSGSCGCGCGCGSTTAAPSDASTTPVGTPTEASSDEPEVTTVSGSEAAEVTTSVGETSTMPAGKRAVLDEDRQWEFLFGGRPGRGGRFSNGHGHGHDNGHGNFGGFDGRYRHGHGGGCGCGSGSSTALPVDVSTTSVETPTEVPTEASTVAGADTTTDNTFTVVG